MSDLLNFLTKKCKNNNWLRDTFSWLSSFTPIEKQKKNLMYARLLKTSIFILLVLISSCNRQEEKMVAKSDSIAYQLATINAGQPISPSDPNIKKFENLIAALSSKYVEDKERIANITVKSHGMLKKEGISTSLLEIMDGMNQLVSERDTINKYPEFMAIYHTSRIAGDSHEDTILNIKALLRSLGVR